MFSFQKSRRDGVYILELQGKLNALTAPELKGEINEVAQRQDQKIVVVLEQLEVIDSSGIGALVSLFKRVRAANGDVKLAGIQGQPKEIFGLLNLNKAFDIQDTIELAIARF